MVKAIFLFTLTIIIVFITGCHKCTMQDEHYYLAQEDKLIYKVNDKLIYKSNTGELDTFNLYYIEENTSFISYGGYCEDKGKRYDYMNGNLKNSKNERLDLHYVSSGRGFYASWKNCVFNDDYGHVVIQQFNVQNITYSDVFYVIKDTILHPEAIVWKMYYSKSNGILSVTERTGKTFELYQVISSK